LDIWCLYPSKSTTLASISKQVAWRSKQVFQAKKTKKGWIRKSVVVHLNAWKSSNFYHVIVSMQSSLTFCCWHFASCFLLGGREAISAFAFWRIASCFENRSIGFQRHSCFEIHVMAYNLNAARQFHSLFGVELASNTPTCVELSKRMAWLWGPRQIGITDPATFFVSTWTPTSALRWTRSNARAWRSTWTPALS